MAAHVNRENVIVVVELRRDVVEGVGDAADPVQHDEGLLALGAPVKIVQAQAVDGDEAVLIGTLRGQRNHAHSDQQCLFHVRDLKRLIGHVNALPSLNEADPSTLATVSFSPAIAFEEFSSDSENSNSR